MQSRMANNHGLHSHTGKTSTAYYFLLVEVVLWVNSQSQPTSALQEISTIFLLFTHRLYKWRSQPYGVQGKANQTNCGREKDSAVTKQACTGCISHFLFTQKQRHTNMKGDMSNDQHRTFVVSVWCVRWTEHWGLKTFILLPVQELS